MFCLPKFAAENFIQALKEGRIDPEKLSEMTSEERNTFFEGIVGKEDAAPVNALFESKLLLKDYKRGLVTWAKRVSGISGPIRRDLIERIEKLDKVLSPVEEKSFFTDLASEKLGTKVSLNEAKIIAEKSKDLQTSKAQWDKRASEVTLTKDPFDKNAGWQSEEQRLAYGFQLAEFRSHLGDLKNSNANPTLKESIAHPIATLKRGTYATFGITKSLLSSLDNSFYGRQGIKALYTHPSIWAKDFLKSWGDIDKVIIGKDTMKLIEADVLSRANAMNGKYRSMGLDVGISFEEAFPTALQERVPGVGRFFKAADVAFSGGAMRMRADLADLLIPKAEEFGLSMINGKDARGVGRLINGMTGRGYIGGASGKAVNVLFFSIKFFKSNFDTLTGHTLWQGDLSPQGKAFLRKEAATNLVKIAGTTAAIMATAYALNPDSTSLDPRSTKFGKIKINDTTIDFTGGMGSLITLASRLVPTLHNGKWSWWTKNKKGQYVDLHSGKYGQATPWDALLSFFAGKLAPIPGVFRDVLEGQTYSGKKPTILNETTGAVTPLPIQTYFDLRSNPNAAPLLLGMIADGLGFSTFTPPKK